MFELTGQQKYAGEELKHWWFNKASRKRNYFEISGAPGTGKSTIVFHIMPHLGLNVNEIAYVAYTGKAALNLTLKSCPTKTIHSIVYALKVMDKIDNRGVPILKNGERVRVSVFVKRPVLDSSIKVIVIDEGSMINHKMGEELLSFGVPIVILGDINQLKPIYGDSFFLRTPDVILTEILRQRKDDPIVQLCQMVLNNHPISIGSYGEMCHVISKEYISDRMLMQSDIIICGKNKTRSEINAHVRENIYGREPNTLVVGDKIICRRNNWDISINEHVSLINGLIGYVTEIHTETYNDRQQSIDIDFKPDFTDVEFTDIKVDLNYLRGNIVEKLDKMAFKKTDMNLIEYGNAITCHLAQGSQYNSVFIYNEYMGSKDDYKRWLYTAISRAETKLILAM
jgi:exodeoxyribonuclease-5